MEHEIGVATPALTIFTSVKTQAPPLKLSCDPNIYPFFKPQSSTPLQLYTRSNRFLLISYRPYNRNHIFHKSHDFQDPRPLNTRLPPISHHIFFPTLPNIPLIVTPLRLFRRYYADKEASRRV